MRMTLFTKELIKFLFSFSLYFPHKSYKLCSWRKIRLNKAFEKIIANDPTGFFDTRFFNVKNPICTQGTQSINKDNKAPLASPFVSQLLKSSSLSACRKLCERFLKPNISMLGAGIPFEVSMKYFRNISSLEFLYRSSISRKLFSPSILGTVWPWLKFLWLLSGFTKESSVKLPWFPFLTILPFSRNKKLRSLPKEDWLIFTPESGLYPHHPNN